MQALRGAVTQRRELRSRGIERACSRPRFGGRSTEKRRRQGSGKHPTTCCADGGEERTRFSRGSSAVWRGREAWKEVTKESGVLPVASRSGDERAHQERHASPQIIMPVQNATHWGPDHEPHPARNLRWRRSRGEASQLVGGLTRVCKTRQNITGKGRLPVTAAHLEQPHHIADGVGKEVRCDRVR